ncbi:uncharacterized protein EDB93DRAFT_1243692 [Suillus bovinus]|uniref:uncharacterized protein n=1 Tax=Suillus bovinus TaxID=48563 RepID=UPI001B86B5CA|nr:uncharacterized protein EDB93DRAFT_1243692 [Suillus bovinus]KAG2127534.1 hypothetical protein EDB93DRAFT_1243692 [Suillus bovinus]
MSHGSGCTRFNGLSKLVVSHSFRGHSGKQSQHVANADAMCWAEIQEMSMEDHDTVHDMITDYGIESNMLPHTAPPREEGLEFSHVGGEHKAFEGLASQIAGISGGKPNSSLGYSNRSPLYPNVVISLRTLATYCQIHRTCPHFSIQAQCKALCFLYSVTAYDIYLEIVHCVNKSCFYKLQDEPALHFDWLVSIDGNNSLKHWDSTIYDYWIEPATVDQFKGEVKA